MVNGIRRLFRIPISLPTAMNINPARILMLPVVLLAACASDPSTAVAPSASSAAGAHASDAPFTDSVYDTPAAYEESAATATTAGAVPLTGTAADSSAAALPDHAPATIHTVVKGDTLSGLSAKYRVPMASIMSANRMTDDKVILGRKMVIPPH